MKIAIRTDASLEIGSGHVMRCLTLADALTAQGAHCRFITRKHAGHLAEVICRRGYEVDSIEMSASTSFKKEKKDAPTTIRASSHADWLGVDWKTDCQDVAAILGNSMPDWLLVDHYAIDSRWEKALKSRYRRLLVIDDLADRPHICDLLINQNLGSQSQDYASLVPPSSQLLIGPKFAILRPEFAALRSYSLRRRSARPNFRHLMIAMGGVDQWNATEKILESLKGCSLPSELHITIAMGSAAPWLERIKKMAEQMPWPTTVVVNVDDIAKRMADSDLAIGGAGGTAWERCCLGLPTLMIIMAQNQQAGAQALEVAKAVHLIGFINEIDEKLPSAIHRFMESENLAALSSTTSTVVDGEGVKKILSAMKGLHVE